MELQITVYLDDEGFLSPESIKILEGLVSNLGGTRPATVTVGKPTKAEKAPTPAPAPVEEEEVDTKGDELMAEAIKLATEAADADLVESVKEQLRLLGVKRVKELTVAQLPAFIAAIKKALL